MELWIAIIATHNALPSGNSEMDKIRMQRVFQTLRQRPEETPLMFKERFMVTLDGVKQLGVDISGNADPSYLPSNLALRYISGSDPGRYSTLMTELKNDIAKGNDSYPTTVLEAFNLAQRWKSIRPKSIETSKPLGVYLNQKVKRDFRGGHGGARNGAGENGGGQLTGDENGQPGNFTHEFMFMCDGVGHRKKDCPHTNNVNQILKGNRDDVNQVAVTKRSRVSFEDGGPRATFVIRNVILTDQETETYAAAGGIMYGIERKNRHATIETSLSIHELYTSVHSAIKYGLEWKDTYVVMGPSAESSCFNDPMLLSCYAHASSKSCYV